MRAWLVVCAALALAPCRATAAHPDPARLDRIKSQILAKLGLSTRPTPLGAPPRDVVRQILARAADPHPPPRHDDDPDQAMREVIAIAHRVSAEVIPANKCCSSANIDKCSLKCSGAAGAPTFLNGHKYQYGVEGVVTIFLSGADKQETSVKLLGQASVTVLGNCEHELSVQNLVISGPDGKKYPSPPGVEKPVQFTLQDGRVGAEICAQDGDTRRSLNIKRAIISLLQTEQKPSTQVDVFGTCPTDVSSSQEGGAVLVHRTRDLSRCGHREQSKNDLLTGIYNPSAEIKDTQVLQSTLHVESKVNHGVPEKVSATEEYLYKPFSVGENGARAKVHTKLTLTGKAAAASSPSQCTESRTIIFETPHGVSASPNNQQSVLAAVKETAKTCTKEAGPKSAGNFAQLIRILRTTTKDDLMKVFNHVKANSVEKRVFLDSLIRAGTGFSIETSINLLKSKQLDKLEEAVVYLSLGYARHVTDDALKAAASLVDQAGIPKEVYLGVGALAGSYCREHACHSGGNSGIAAISQKLASKLQNCKPNNKEEEDYVVAVLKGIRNIRHLEDNLVDKLARCITDNSVKARVKVAALEAIHADPCATKVHSAAMDLMQNLQLDSEIRIKAYLAVIECPCAHSATLIKNLLDKEPIYQVGNFITSSLRHIRSSANPDRQLARLHYGNIRTPNKFRLDERKYSFYKELSYNVDALGLGGNMEQTVIYSQDSFLPRSVHFNLTTEVFGHSLNVFEIGGRQGNMDRVVEHFVGPKGAFMGSPAKIYEDLLRRYEESKKRVEEKFSRGRRSVKSEIDNFDKSLKAEAISYNNELDLDIYMKLFGTDAVFLSLGNNKGFNIDSALDDVINFVNTGINEVKHFQKEVNANLLFLDAELTYPTSTGLPLKLDLIGAITARFEASTNVDIRQIIQSPQSAKLDIKLIPSTDVEVAGLFLIDADAVTTGLKVVSNLHSSTGGHVIAKVLENGNGFDLQLGLPIEKQEILTASNDLVYVTFEKGQKEKHVPVKVDTDRKEYAACFDQLSGVLGLTVCGEVSVPFVISGNEAQASIAKFLARYPLTGSTKVKLVVEKNDLRGYHIKGIYRHDNTRHNVELLFDAEGSKNRRTHVTGEVVYSAEEYSIKLGLDSPIKVISGEVSLYNKPSELLAIVKAKCDQSEYYGKLGFNIQGNQQRSVFRPILEYQVPAEEKRSIPIEGQVIREVNGPDAKYTLEGIHLRLPSVEEPVEIGGYVAITRKDLTFDVKVKDKANMKGCIEKQKIMVEFQNTINPYINFRVDMKNENLESHGSQADLELIYGGDLRNSRNKVVLSRMIKYHDVQGDYNFITRNKFEIYALPLKIKFNADVDPKKLILETGGQYMDRTAEFDLEARTKIKKAGDYTVKVTAGVDKNTFEIFAKRDIESADKSNFENYLAIKNFGRYELSGVVLHKNKPNDVNVGAIGHFKVTSGKLNEDIKFDVGVIVTTTLYSSHGKVTNSKGDLVDFLLKVNKGANPNGQLKLILKDTIAANGQFKVTDSDGKGNGMIIVDFKRTQRKIKADVKFVVKAPVYSGDFDVFLNYEKDNSDKVCFTTSTKNTDKVFDTKNTLEYGGKKSELNIHHDGTYTDSGKNHALVEVVLPTERCLSLKVDRDISINDGVYNGHAELFLSDAVKRGSAASTISYKSKISNSNFEKNTVNYEGQLELCLKDGQKLQNTFYLKNNPDGNDKYKYDFKSDVTGSLLSKPMSLSAAGVYLDSDVSVDEDFRFKGSYGENTGFELVGKWIVKLLEKGERKFLEDFTVNIRLPFEKAHDIKWVSTMLYLQPENKDVAEYTLIEALQINGEQYKVDANGKAGLEAGSGVLKLVVPHVDPVVLDVGYKNKEAGEKRTNFAEVKAKYGKGKTATMSLETTVAPRDVAFVIKSSSPQESAYIKKLEVSVHSKNPAPDTYSSSIIVDVDGRVYKSEYTTVISKTHPLIDFKYYNPKTSKTSRVYIKGETLSSSQGKATVKVENIRNINLDFTSEANVQKDNVAFKLVANSDELGCKNYEVEIASKDSGSGKRLEFHAVNDGKNVLSGSTSFLSKQEGQKTIIEGSGSVKLKEEQKSANFKYIRTLLTEGNEKGVETFFNIAIGERSYVAEARVTNLEYKNSYVYCEEKKQCAHAEIQSKIDVSKPGCITNLVNAGVDLRKLGVAPEFGLQIKDEVSDKRPPQYTLDLHVSKEELKYHLHVYNTPEFGNSKSGITVTLPKRTVALESSVSYPTNKNLPFPVKGEFSIDADKRKQGHKTSARFLVDLNVDDEKKQFAVAEIGFNHPRINKEATVKFGGEIVRPQPNTIKIETHAAVSHPSLGNDRESKIYFEANPTHFKLLVDTPLVKVIDVEGSATVKENLQQGELKFCLLQGKPVQVRAIVKDYQYYEFTSGYSDESDRKLSIVGHLEPEKRVDISADIILGGDKKNIIHGALFLQDNLVKSDYGISKENFNYFLNALKNDLTTLEGRIKQLGAKANKDFKAITKKVEPTLKNLQQTYGEDLDGVYQAFASDESFKQIAHVITEIVEYINSIINQIEEGIKPLVDKIVETYTEVSKKIQELYEKQLEPQITKLYETFAKLMKEYLDGLIDLVAHFAALVTDFFEKHKAELNELTATFTEIFKDATRVLVAQLKEFKSKLSQVFEDLLQNIKDLPIISVIKEKWEEFSVPEQVLELVQQAHGTVRVLVPTPETREFLDALHDYVQAKLRQQKVDDGRQMRIIYQKLATAVTSIVQFVRAQLGQFAAPSALGFNSFVLPIGFGQSAPSLGGSASFSLLGQALRGDLPDPLSLVRAYRPRSFNPLDEVPAKLRGVVVGGQHIFTFDGRHLTFPGTCRYVLAHDHVDRNFTLAIQLQNGAPKALILEDKSGTIIELKENGQVTLNNANHGFPVIEKDVFAFRQANGRIGLGSEYGLMVFCSNKLQECYVEVSGFYLGKLRGLLGDGNNEPYDDFRLPNGKIVTSESEFGNAYRLARSCPAASAPPHAAHQLHAALPAACERVFGGDSPLRPLALLLDVGPFRQACVHACSGDGEEATRTACSLARGYAALASSLLLPAALPAACLRCTDADTPRALGDHYELKLPNKQADIVVAVEVTKSNEQTYKELVVPLVSQLVDQLKSKRISDIKVYLVGITTKFPYPIMYDTDLKLKNAKVQFTDESRYAKAPQFGNNFVTTLSELANTIRNKLGLTNVVAGYNYIFDLPLRAGAVKHTISVVGEACHPQFFLLSFLRSITYASAFENMAYSHSLVTQNFKNVHIEGAEPANIVGVTKHDVFLLGAKRATKESEKLRASFTRDQDACIDFVEDTDGIVFSASAYLALNPGQQKQYLQTAGAALGQRALRHELRQDCSCVYAGGQRARSLCYTADRRDASRRRK